MYYPGSAGPPNTRISTLLSTVSLFWILSVFILQVPTVASRNVYNHLLYTRFKSPVSSLLLGDHTQLEIDELTEDWANVQGLLDSSETQSLRPTPSRQQADLRAAPSELSSVLASSSPTPIALYDPNLQRRDIFTSNVCPISIQTTIYVSIDGTSTVTLSTTVGPRPTGIPGDAGTSDGTNSTGVSAGTGNSSVQSFGDKEGLITGLAIVIIILLASFCALVRYFYKRRKNARLQRLSVQPGSDTADMVRRMGSRGFMSIPNQGRHLTRLWQRHGLQIQNWSPVVFIRRVVHQLRTAVRRDGRRDSQSSELLEWKRPADQRSTERPWSDVEVPVVDVGQGEKLYQQQSSPKRESSSSIPENFSPPAISEGRLPIPSKPSTRPYSGELVAGFVPLVQRRVSLQKPLDDRLSALQPVAIEAVRLGPTVDFTHESSPRRLSSAWMAGFELASAANGNPFNDPSYVSSSDRDLHTSLSGHLSSKQSEGPTSPLNTGRSFSSERTTRERRRTSQRPRVDTLSTVSEHGDVKPDGASDIMSTLGSAFQDHTGSYQSRVTMDTMNDFGQTTRYNDLSDVEEVLSAVADQRLSLQSPMSLRDSLSPSASRSFPPPNPNLRSMESSSPVKAELATFQNPFADEAELSLSSAPSTSRINRPPPKATSLRGGVLPSEKSDTSSLTEMSIVEPPSPIDTWDDDISAMRKEAEWLFYARGPSSDSMSGPQNRR